MPIFALDDSCNFPDPNQADQSGLLAVGGDLSSNRIIKAYEQGIFPWFSEGDPILWWSPDPRMILFPEKLNVSKSLRQSLNNSNFEVTFDKSFVDVVTHCSNIPRKDQDGTWITKEMKQAYLNLHELGYAHSVETWLDGELVGGLYGISLGHAFFGESMFYTRRDASKIALYHLTEKIINWGFFFIDAQIETDHMQRMGAENISRNDFLKLLNKALKHKTKKGKW